MVLASLLVPASLLATTWLPSASLQATVPVQPDSETAFDKALNNAGRQARGPTVNAACGTPCYPASNKACNSTNDAAHYSANDKTHHSTNNKTHYSTDNTARYPTNNTPELRSAAYHEQACGPAALDSLSHLFKYRDPRLVAASLEA